MVLFLIGVTYKVQYLLEGRGLLEGGAYFDEDNQGCGAYLIHGTYYRKCGIPE